MITQMLSVSQKILLIAFIFCISLFGQSAIPDKIEKISGEILWGEGYFEKTDEKSWYEYAVYDNEEGAFVTIPIKTNQNFFSFEYQKGNRHLNMTFIYTIGNEGFPIKVSLVKATAKNGSTIRDIYRTTDGELYIFFNKQEYEVCRKKIDRFGDTNISYWEGFSHQVSYIGEVNDIVYAQKVFDYNKGKEQLTKRTGIFQIPEDAHWEQPHVIVFETEMFILKPVYSSAGFNGKLEDNIKLFDSPKTRQLSDLTIVEKFLSFGVEFETYWKIFF